MNKLKEKLSRFMYGRYGIDNLWYVLLAIYAVLLVVNMFVHSHIINLILAAVIVYMIYRSMSKNIAKRRAENTWLMNLWTRVKELRTNVYRTCPKCKANLRLPRRKGNHTVVCPRCHEKFETKVLF